MQLPNPGQWFQRRYELGELLGKGGFAAVYRAVDHDVGREVAIKILMPDHNGYEKGLVQRFMREGRIVASLQDPNTITMYDFGRTEDDLLFMVFEYVPGSDLAKLLIRTGPMPEATVVHILMQTMAALREAHGAGILHRDIKPANILIHTYMEDDRRVKLLDFGIAKPTMQEGEVDELEENKSGMSPGTPRYMSPEQIYGDELTPATDIFSLGLVAYELLSGKPAVSGRTTKETLLNQLSEKPILLPPFLRVTPQLRAVVERMCLKRANQRPQSVQEVMRELSQIGGLSMERALPRPQDRTKVPRKPVVELSDKSKDKLSTAGLVAAAVVVLGALMIPLSKVVKKALEDEPPPVVVQRPVPQVAVAEIRKSAPEPEPEPVVEELVSGCGAEPPFTGRSTATFSRGMIDRHYYAYVPDDYDPNHKHPTILLLRDKRSPAAFLAETGFDGIANRVKAIVLAPEGRDEEYAWSPRADADWIQDMHDDAATKFCIDRTKRFAVGQGVSGKAVEELPCYLTMSGIATLSYLPPLGAKPLCDEIEATPSIQLFGKGNINPQMTGKSECQADLATMSWDKKTETTFERNGCEGPTMPWGKHSDGSCVTKLCPDAGVVACLMDGSYEYSDTVSIPFANFAVGDKCKPKPTKFNVAATVWEFFASQGLAVDPAVRVED